MNEHNLLYDYSVISTSSKIIIYNDFGNIVAHGHMMPLHLAGKPAISAPTLEI